MVFMLVAKGEVEMGLVVVTIILNTTGIELVGPPPAEVRSYIVFAAGVSTNSSAPAAVKELINF